MKSIALILMGALLIMVFIPISSADSSTVAGGFSWRDFLINLLLTLVIWRALMTLFKAFRRPKKSTRKKYRKKRQTPEDKNPVLFDE